MSAPQFMFLFRDAEDAAEPAPDQLDRLMRWLDGLKTQGQVVACAPLDGPACVLRGAGGLRVTDGPFAESKEVIGGFLVVTEKNYPAAEKLARTCPILAAGTSIEVRQLSPIDGRLHSL